MSNVQCVMCNRAGQDGGEKLFTAPEEFRNEKPYGAEKILPL